MKKTRKIVESGIMRAVLCVLCAACIIYMNTACTTPTSGPEIDDENPPVTIPDDPTNPGGNGGTTTNPDNPKPVEPVEEELKLDLHCFTEGVTSFNVGGGYEGAAKFQSEYTKVAQKYIKDKFTALQTQMQAENPTENTFKTVLNDAVNLKGTTAPYNTAEALTLTLDRGIPAFYGETAKYIAQIVNNLDGDDQAKFRACYDHLAAHAYEKSLTVKEGGKAYATLATVTQDKPEIATELSNLHIANQDVEKTLMTLLKQVAAKQDIQASTLKDSVNLALDIDGLYGLRDSVMVQGGVPAQTRSSYQNWDVAVPGGRENMLPPRARYSYDPMKYGYTMYQKPMFNNMLDKELQKLQQQTQSYEMGR